MALSPSLPKACDFCPTCLRVMKERDTERRDTQGEEEGKINRRSKQKWKERGKRVCVHIYAVSLASL